MSYTKKSPATDTVNFKGFVTIYQEDDNGNRTYICKDLQNHFTKHMIRGLCSYFCGNYIHTYVYFYRGSVTLCSGFYNILLGTDTTTATTYTTNELTNKININPSFKHINDVNTIDENSGQYVLKILSRWEKGTVSGTIGEIGLYMLPLFNISPNWTYASESIITFPTQLCSRFAVADGAFESFEIDITKTLVIEYHIGVSYV